jgi:hypothetical protein
MILKKDKAILLHRAAAIKSEIKELEKEFKKVKKQLDLNKKGTYTTKLKDPVTLVIGETKNYSDIDSHLLFKYMKEQKQLKHFWGCVKVQMTNIKKFVPESRFSAWRKELDPILKWSFK